MSSPGPFAKPAWWLAGAHLAAVTSVSDPMNLARVQVQLVGPDPEGDALLWARVAVPFAGDNRGAFLIPDVGDEVLVLFAGQDARSPVVVGALWNGAAEVPETLGGDRVDRWTITGKNGTRIAIVERGSGQETVEIETPGGVKATLTDKAGGKITLEAAGSTATIDPKGVSVSTGAKFSVSAGQIEMTAGQFKVNAALAQFSDIVMDSIGISTSVISQTYTPGAGNIW